VIEVFAASATLPDIAVFSVAAIMSLAGAVGVLVSRNPVHAALSLVLTLFGIAVLFVAQEAHFLAAVQVIVYAGAIVVLFLFVIMLLGVDKADVATTPDRFKSWRPFVVVLGLAAGGLVIALAKWNWDATGAPSLSGPASGDASNIERLAESIFTQYLLPFEATSLLLVIAVVAAVVLARRPSYETDLLADADETPDVDASEAATEESIEVTK
jgi:NADH-quinone oxidoreductase subunit J